MIIEIRVGRTWQIWVDGISPSDEWVIGEGVSTRELFPDERAEEFTLYKTQEMDGTSLTFQSPLPGSSAALKLEWIAFDSVPEDWTCDYDGTKFGPCEAFVKFEGQEPVYINKIVYWYPTERDGEVTLGIHLEDGRWCEIDETQAYVRMEVE